MNTSKVKRAAAVGGAIYAIVEVVLYMVGAIWPEAAPHAQFISGKLTPLIIILSNYLILGDDGLDDVPTTRSVDPAITGSVLPRPMSAKAISPVVTLFEKLFGWFKRLA